jgi:hypothetical protein
MKGYHHLFGNTSFPDVLVQFDADQAAQTKEEGCPCGGALHVANYTRKPRGGPSDLDRSFSIRFSFCCERDGCRRRATPASIRFLGRRVYFGAVVALVSAMRHGLTKLRVATLHRLLGVSERTLRRWRIWWLEGFTATPLWRIQMVRFMPPVALQALPRSLIERFIDAKGRLNLPAALRFLSPLTASGSIAAEHAF